jgi:opacity protein-like surface antigen
MKRRAIVLTLALTAGLLAPASARAQSFGDVALVATAAPVYLLPDATRTPLRTLPVGVALTILQRQGDWLQVTFEDAQLGRRTAWIEAKAVRIRPASAEPAPEPPDPPAAAGARPGAAPSRPPATQSRRPAPRRPAAQPIGARIFGGAALEWMSAKKSFDAVTESDRVTSYGGGVQATNLWRGLFLEGAVARATADGERVFVLGGEVYRLGIPVEITMTPVDVVAGWRTPVGRVVPYLGGGMTFFKYQETSDFADDDENVDEWYRGFVVMGGVEAGITRWVHVRADLRYRQVNDAFGLGGASQAFGEDRLGGFAAGVQLVLGR